MDLQGIPARVEQELAQLNAADPDDRTIALNTMKSLVMDFVVPNMGLARQKENGGEYFDVNAIAGCEVSGLLLDALFDPQFADLKQPPDTILKQALDAVGINMPNAADRITFFRCWTASRAVMSVRCLLNFLTKTPPQSAAVAGQEVDHIVTLLEYPLPQDLKRQLLYATFTFDKERARALQTQASGPYVAETLGAWLGIPNATFTGTDA